jgi:hypothetical protein
VAQVGRLDADAVAGSKSFHGIFLAEDDFSGD